MTQTTGYTSLSEDNSPLPTTLLWIPYVCLTILILVFVLASFLHYHLRHGHKYGTRADPDENDCGCTNCYAHLVQRMTEAENATSGESQRRQGHRRALRFNSNRNGSMVEIRCGLTDSLKTFERLQVDTLLYDIKQETYNERGRREHGFTADEIELLSYQHTV